MDGDLTGAVEASIAKMQEVMITSIEYNTEITEITTLLGKNANRAATEVPTRG